jgi:hypothetical protein
MPRLATHDWPAVLSDARTILEIEGLLPRPELWDRLVQRGTAEPHGADGFRAALWTAQRRGEFPVLPRARTGPRLGTEWSEDRHAAELARQDEPTPFELYTERLNECEALLRDLAGVVTVRLSPNTLGLLAAQGYGVYMVKMAAHMLVRTGRARLRWEVSGIERVPCLRAA